jgi:hypothetical protein
MKRTSLPLLPQQKPGAGENNERVATIKSGQAF